MITTSTLSAAAVEGLREMVLGTLASRASTASISNSQPATARHGTGTRVTAGRWVPRKRWRGRACSRLVGE